MIWKRAILNNLPDGSIVRSSNNITVSSMGNLIDNKGVYKTFDGPSVALVQKGSLGIVSDRKIHILSSRYLTDNIDKIAGEKTPFQFNVFELRSLLKDTTHVVNIHHSILNDFETLT